MLEELTEMLMFPRSVEALPELRNYPDGFWLNVMMGLIALAATIELWKYIKDRYWFGTWNWRRQADCRTSMQIYNAMHWQLGTYGGFSEFSFPMSEKIMLLESMKRWDKLTRCNVLTPEEYDKTYQATAEWFNKSENLKLAYGAYQRRGRDKISPKAKAYGYTT